MTMWPSSGLSLTDERSINLPALPPSMNRERLASAPTFQRWASKVTKSWLNWAGYRHETKPRRPTCAFSVERAVEIE
jgi:hypothetical protein